MISKIMSVELLRANMMYFVSFVLFYWMYILFRRRLHHRDAEEKYLTCHKGKNPTKSTETHPLVLNYQAKNLSTLETHSVCSYTLVTAEELLVWARRINLSHTAKRCQNNWNQRGNFFRFLRTSKSLKQLTTMHSKLWFSSYHPNWAL